MCAVFRSQVSPVSEVPCRNFEQALAAVVSVLENNTRIPEDAKAFVCVQERFSSLKQRLQRVFQASVSLTRAARVEAADAAIKEAISLLAVLEPPVLVFRTADA